MLANHKSIIQVLFFLLLPAAFLQAQFIVQQVEYEVPVSYDLVPEDQEFESEEAETLFFMTIPFDKLKQAALAEGNDVSSEESALYLAGNKFAAENTSEFGKISVISDASDGVMYMVRWAQKTVVIITPEDMKKVEEKTTAAVEESLKMLSPEMQAQVREAMKQEKQDKPAAKKAVKATGKKMTINGFNCQLYLITDEDTGTAKGVWAAADNMNITSEVEKISEKFSKIFNMDDEQDSDEWTLMPGMIPVEVREKNFMSEMVFNISVLKKIEKKSPPADKFYVPGEKDGFKRMSFSEMMQQMMPQGY